MMKAKKTVYLPRYTTNVRFWHTADELTELRSYMSDQRSLLTAFFVNQRGAGHTVGVQGA